MTDTDTPGSAPGSAPGSRPPRSPGSPGSPDARPIPARYWWLKRLGVAAGVLVVAVVALRLVWGYRAAARLEATVDAIAAAGEPIRFEDMVIHPVADKDNKAYYLRQALANWPAVNAQGQVITDTDWYNYSDGWGLGMGTYGGMPGGAQPTTPPQRPPDPIADNKGYLAECGTATEFLRQVARADGVDWRWRPNRPLAGSMSMPHYSDMRGLARLMGDAAERATESQDPALLLELARLGDHAADAVDAPPNFVMGHLIAISIRMITAHTAIEEHLPSIQSGLLKEGAGRVQAELLLAKLLDESGMQAGYTRSWIGERWYALECGRDIAAGRMPVNYWASGQPSLKDHLNLVLLRPAYNRDVADLLQYDTAVLQAIERTDHHATFMSHVGRSRLGSPTGLNPLAHPISSPQILALHASHRTHFQALTIRRLAATALAIRLYEEDYRQRPQSLSTLVPDYLPTIPDDPWGPPGSPVRYSPQGAKVLRDMGWMTRTLDQPGPAIVYSVGANGIDDGGTIIVDKDYSLMHMQAYRDTHDVDMWFLLDAMPDLADTSD